MYQGRKIVLRAIEPSEIVIIHRWLNDESICRNLSRYWSSSLEEIQEECLNLSSNSLLGQLYAIDLNGEIIGFIKLTNIDWICRSGELTIVIGEEENRGKGYGSMLTGYSFGMLLGAIAIKRIVTRFSILRIFSGAIFFGGISYMILGMTSLLIVAIICFVLCGFFFNIVSISFVTTIQQKVPISQQGSIFGLIGMIGMGVTPLSTLAASLLLLVIDIKSSFLLSGGLIALIGFVAFFNPLMKSKFVERGEVKAYD